MKLCIKLVTFKEEIRIERNIFILNNIIVYT
jgi:hypothetical protein